MTDYKSMFEQAARTLAAIDEALGIGDDGCGITSSLSGGEKRSFSTSARSDS